MTTTETKLNEARKALLTHPTEANRKAYRDAFYAWLGRQ